MDDFFDIKTDDRFTYGMRIDVGKVLSDETLSDVDKFKRTFEIVYNHTPNPREYSKLIYVFEEIISGFSYWINAENSMLRSTPSPEELAAGVEEYSEVVGELATVVTLSKDYNTFPNVILSRPYSEIFGILLADKKKAEFEKRLMKVYNSKSKWKQ